MSTATLHPPICTPAFAAPTYRLTRRGRLVIFVLGFVAIVALGLVFAGGSVATRDAEQTQTIVVGPGDTLWDLASDVSDGGDVREMMRHIQQLNSLDTVDLVSGQRLVVPAQ